MLGYMCDLEGCQAMFHICLIYESKWVWLQLNGFVHILIIWIIAWKYTSWWSSISLGSRHIMFFIGTLWGLWSFGKDCHNKKHWDDLMLVLEGFRRSLVKYYFNSKPWAQRYVSFGVVLTFCFNIKVSCCRRQPKHSL